jgi:hypothetical protein
MDYAKYIRKLELPAGYRAPANLSYDTLVASAIGRTHLSDDVRGINESIDLIRQTRGRNWPTEPVSEDFNFVDLIWHELEFRDGTSFTYAVHDLNRGHIGCCYLYPMGRRTTLTEGLLEFDVVVNWWVTPGAYTREDYLKLFKALRRWLESELPFHTPYFSNAEIPQE